MPTLTWAGKEEATRTAKSVSYRMLERDDSLSYGDLSTENVIVQGDNLSALKAILPYYRGRVRCVYIDPPYNTGAAFEHYDDNVEHGTWLSLMYPRLELLRDLLSEDGSIWISIDDDEGHYLKVMCDEIFGRNNFVSTVIWEKKYAPQGNSQWLTDSHDYILLYARTKDIWHPNLLPRTEEMNKKYKNPDNDPRGLWRPDNATISLSGGQRGAQYARTGYSENIYELEAPNGKTYFPPKGRCWYYPKEKMLQAIKEGIIFFGKDGQGAPQLKRFFSQVKKGSVAMTLWERDEVGDNQEAKRESRTFNSQSVFATPKPERLIERILTLATNPGDIVLDSFLGSGTTAAVAHKMNRRYVGIEIGDHAVTHVVPRLRKVIDGEQGGISKTENWQGGGGFSFYRLGEEVFTAEGKIRQGVKFVVLAAHIWMTETKLPYPKSLSPNGKSDSPLIGINDGVAYYLLYNGILGDKRPNGGNVLTKKVLASLPPHEGTRIIYGESSRIHENTLKSMGIIFKQTPKAIRED